MNYYDKKFLEENLKDPSLAETIYKSNLKRARTMAVMLGSFLILALIAVVYAYVRQTAAFRQEKIAVESAEYARLTVTQLEEQLKACQNKTN